MKSLFRSRNGGRGALRVGATFTLAVGTIAMVAGLAIASPAGADAANDVLAWAVGGAPTSTVAGNSENVVVDVDLSGGGVDTSSSDVITLSLGGGISASEWGPATETAVDGVATFTNFHINESGSYTVTATDTTTPAVTDVQQSGVTITAASPNKLAFTEEPPATTSGSFPVEVTVEDSYGNNVGGIDAVVLNTATTGCALSGTTSENAVAGVATFSGVTLSGTSNQGCVLTAQDNTETVTNGTSSAVSSLGAASKVAFTTEPPTAATYGVDMTTFRVSVEDSNGNVVDTGLGSTDGITLTPSAGCTLTNNTATAVAGVATFSTSYFSSGTTCTLTASDSTRTLSTAVSSSISVSSTSPTKLGFSTEPPTAATAGSLLATFRVSTEQGNGITVTTGADTTDTVVLTSTCKLLGTTAAAEVAGVATFSDVSFQSSGSCTLVASDASNSAITASTSTSILVSASTPTHVAFTKAPPTTESSLTTALASFAVSVEDVYDNVAATSTGSTDVITITSNCTLSGTTSVAAVSGVATFSAVTVTSPGACVLTATDTSRVITTATANVQVGEPQATLSVTSVTGYLGTPLKLTTSGGSGTGAVTFAVVNGTATGCAITNNALTSTTEGTCIVTATKASSGTYGVASSAATTVSIGKPLLHIARVIGGLYRGRSAHITLSGVSFYGRPKVISNAAGFIVRVARDTGTSLVLIVTVSVNNHAGTHVITVIEPNGQRASARYTLH